MQLKVYFCRILIAIAWFACMGSPPIVLGQDTLVLVSPEYDVTGDKSTELEGITENLKQRLKFWLNERHYTCLVENFQDWNSYSKEDKVDIMDQSGAKYVISTGLIKVIRSHRPSEEGFEIDFIIQRLNDDNELERLTWYDSKYIIKSAVTKSIDFVAAQVSKDFDFYCSQNRFKPRFKIGEFQEMTGEKKVDEIEFANWLEKLLKEKIHFYIFYYDDIIYPSECNNILTGEFSDENGDSGDLVNVIIILEAVNDRQKCKNFKVRTGSDDFLVSESSKNALVEEIENKVKKLINNSEP